jgi:hypothetical protein
VLIQLVTAPVVISVAVLYRLLQAYAPSNFLLRRVRTSRPTVGMAVALVALAFACAVSVQTIRLAMAAGAPEWLNLFVLVLAWDAIKFAVTACLTSMRRIASVVSRTPRLA